MAPRACRARRKMPERSASVSGGRSNPLGSADWYSSLNASAREAQSPYPDAYGRTAAVSKRRSAQRRTPVAITAGSGRRMDRCPLAIGKCQKPQESPSLSRASRSSRTRLVALWNEALYIPRKSALIFRAETTLRIFAGSLPAFCSAPGSRKQRRRRPIVHSLISAARRRKNGEASFHRSHTLPPTEPYLCQSRGWSHSTAA